MWRLLALQNNIRHAGQEGREEEEEEGRWGKGEGGRKLLLLGKNEELVHIDRT